ncbi:MAG: hypothetical protein GY757_39575 [bacterium]|nr:hypothetical protein [bacterium]
MKFGIKSLLLLIAIIILSNFPAVGNTNDKNNTNNNTLKVACNLSGDVKDIQGKDLVIIFSDEMIPLGGDREGNDILTISPAVKGRYLWQGTRSLVFKPETRFRYYTRYTVTVKKGTQSLNNIKLKKEIPLIFCTPSPTPYRISASQHNTGFYSNTVIHRDTIKRIPVEQPLLLRFPRPVTAKEIAKEITITKKGSTVPLPITCRQEAIGLIRLEFPEPLKKDTCYQVTFKKRTINCNGITGAEFVFYLDTANPFRVAGYPKSVSENNDAIRVELSHAPKAITQKDIQVYLLKDREPKTRCPFTVDVDKNYLFISPTLPLTEGRALEIHINKGIESIYGESLDKKTTLNVNICSHRPILIPFLEKENPRLFLKGITDISFSIIKYKEKFLDILTEYYSEPGLNIHKGNFHENSRFTGNIEKEKVLHYQGDGKDLVAFPVNPGNKTKGINKNSPLKKGLWAFKIHHMEKRNKCPEPGENERFKKDESKLKVVNKTDIDFVVKAGAGKIFAWVYNNKTGSAIKGAGISIIRATGKNQRKNNRKNNWKKGIKVGKTNRNGICSRKLTIQKGDMIVVTDPKTRQKAYYPIDENDCRYSGNDPDLGLRAEMFPGRFIYRPGDTIHIGGVLKRFKNGMVKNPGIREVTFVLTDPDGEEVKNETIPLDPFGGFCARHQLSNDCSKGEYKYYIEYRDWRTDSYFYNFKVKYYQPDTIKLELAGDKEVYGKEEPFNPKVTGCYLSGNPMAGAKLKYRLYTCSDYMFSAGNALAEYTFGIDDALTFGRNREISPIEGEAVLDAKGGFIPGIHLDEFNPAPYIHGFYFEIRAETGEGKETTKKKNYFRFPGQRAVGLYIPQINKAQEPIDVKVAAIDSSTQPAETQATLSVFLRKKFISGNISECKKIKEYNGLTFKGKETFKLDGLENGSYLLKCDAWDAKGNIVTTSAPFFVGQDYSSEEGDLSVRVIQPDVPPGKNILFPSVPPGKGKRF